MESHAKYVPIFKALADETRLKIVEMLSCGEMCACDILEYFKITQPTLSYHMKVLTDCGLVKSRKDGSWMKYSNNEELVTFMTDFWENISTVNDSSICNSIKEDKCD